MFVRGLQKGRKWTASDEVEPVLDFSVDKPLDSQTGSESESDSRRTTADMTLISRIDLIEEEDELEDEVGLLGSALGCGRVSLGFGCMVFGAPRKRRSSGQGKSDILRWCGL